MDSSPPGRAGRLGPLISAALPVLATLIFWLLLPSAARENENTDFRLFYRPVARALVSGEGWQPPPGLGIASYPPGYPLLLAGVLGSAERLGIPEGIALDGLALACLSASSLLLFALVRRFADARGALCASFAFSTYPPLLWLSKQPNSELPFLVLLLASVLATADLVRARRLGTLSPFLVGALAGAAMLIRPIALVLPAALALSLLTHRAPWRWRATRIGLILLGAAVAVLPWEVWVAARSGRLVPLSSSGTASMIDGLTFAVRSKGYREPIRVPARVEALMRDLSAKLGTDASPSTIGVSLADAGRDHTVALVELLAIKAARSWYGTDSGRYESALLAVQFPYAVLVILAGWVGWRAGGFTRWLLVATWLIAGSFWAMSVTVLSIARYTTPAAALLIGVSAAALVSARRSRSAPSPPCSKAPPAQRA